MELAGIASKIEEAGVKNNRKRQRPGWPSIYEVIRGKIRISTGIARHRQHGPPTLESLLLPRTTINMSSSEVLNAN